MPRKTEFELVWQSGTRVPDAKIQIEKDDNGRPQVYVNVFSEPMFIKDRDLERFAVNILQALGSKKLAENDTYTRWVYPCEKI